MYQPAHECPSCGAGASLAAGRRARCERCGTQLLLPVAGETSGATWSDTAAARRTAAASLLPYLRDERKALVEARKRLEGELERVRIALGYDRVWGQVAALALAGWACFCFVLLLAMGFFPMLVGVMVGALWFAALSAVHRRDRRFVASRAERAAALEAQLRAVKRDLAAVDEHIFQTRATTRI